MSDLSGCQSLLQLCSCRSNSALQVSCTGYCSVSSHCLADIVEGAFLLSFMLLSLFFALSFLMLVLSLSLLPLLFLLLLTLVLVLLLLLLLYCFSNLGFSCLHPGPGDYLVHCFVRRICCTMYEFFASLIDTLSQPGCVFAHRCVISQL